MSVEAVVEVDINEDLTISDQVTDDGTPSGTPINITGWAIVVVLHTAVGDGAALHTYSTTGGTVTIPSGTNGTFNVAIPNADIAAMGVGDFRWYAYRSTSGQMASLTKGAFRINPV